jgi:transcriptional regulator with PAS, ATPase and Fis domain
MLRTHGVPGIPARLHEIAGLGLAHPDAERCHLPTGIAAEWLQPRTRDGRQLGNVLVLPAPSQPVSRTISAFSAGFEHVVGDSPALRAAVARAGKLARTRVPMLLLGETGVGKEVFARAIHAASPCAEGPLVSINCGGLSRDLLASELFGYVDGAFTGARRGGMKGKIEAADGGTLFLDEIGDMPPDLQPHLLRVLEDGEVYRLGDTQPRKVRFRLLAATHRDLRADVEAQRFRMDLFYRISVTTLELPSLRDRRGDIPALARHFCALFAEAHGLPRRPLDDAALEVMLRHDWPGNVRELRNVVEGLVLTATGDTLGVQDLPTTLRTAAADQRAAGTPATAEEQTASLFDHEGQAIRAAILEARGNLSSAARTLGISKSTLYAKLRRHGHTEWVDSVRIANACRR